MDKRLDMLNRFYNEYDEDSRLVKSRQGQLEFLTTMHYINKLAKKGGIIIVAFISVYAIVNSTYLQSDFKDGIKTYFDENFKIKHFTEQLFTGFDIVEFENLFLDKNVDKIATAAADSVFEIAERNSDFKMSDEDFEIYLKYHLKTCEKRELLGCSNHLLYVCCKNQ